MMAVRMARRQCVLLLVLTITTPCHVTLASPVSASSSSTLQTTNVDLLMPSVQPQVTDTYLCHGMKMNKDAQYVVGFKPRASMEKAHHILIYGCTEPGNSDSVWDCGEMHSGSQKFDSAPVCASGNNIVYAWAMDAPELRLPDGVGFKVGGDTDIQWLVLQVHYKDVSSFLPPNNEKDTSGVVMTVTDQPQPKRAGVYLMGTDGEIPPHSTTYMETACSYNEPVVMHPFAYRTHAHTHGRVNAGYRIRDGNWLEIGRMSPQKPQMFYNVTNPGMTVEEGDVLAARCTMVNDEDKTIKIGSTSKDEMCNFYIMYYVDGDQTLRNNYCFTPGPPTWTWGDLGGLDAALAPLSASIIPGTDQFLAATRRILDEQRQRLDDQLARLLSSLQDTNGDDEDYVRRYGIPGIPYDDVITDDLDFYPQR